MTSNADPIRNIAQTHSERPIIKVAPDMVIYIDNLPFVINDYLGTGGVMVNFNDYVTSVSGSVDIGTPIPSTTITLSVPNHLRHLFQAPGGNRIIQTMSDVKVFGKGYYLTTSGQSVYNRVFWGVLASITYTDNKKTLEISLNCRGVLHLMDIMQTDMHPSALQGGTSVTAFVSKMATDNPLRMIAKMFLDSLSTDVDNVESSQRTATQAQNTLKTPFQRLFIAKWRPHLVEMRSAVRIFGLSDKDLKGLAHRDPTGGMRRSNAYGNPSMEVLNEANKTISVVKPVDADKVANITLIQKYHPDYKIGSIQLLGSIVVSRLSVINEVVAKMGWEFYQDLDGNIVVKPPMYNLDVTMTRTYAHQQAQDIPDDQTRNPFIIHYPEIIGAEVENEDEGQIKMTRSAVQGLLINGSALVNSLDTNTYAEYMDASLFEQFGFRTDSLKVLEFLGSNPHSAFAFAISEMTKANMHWRTYTCTIPFRPELRIGFPVYFPHLDMYGYLTNISWNYTRGGDCQMTLTTSALRTRFMFSVPTTDPATGDKTYGFQSVPNLISRFLPYNPDANPNNVVTSNGTVGPSSITNPAATVLPYQAPLAPIPPATAAVKRKKGNTRVVEAAPTPAEPYKIWQVVADTPPDATYPKAPKGTDAPGGRTGYFDKERPVDWYYFDDIILHARPVSDAKGYALISPFPCGRFQYLEDTLNVCTRPAELQKDQCKKLLYFEALVAADGATSSTDSAPNPNLPPASPFIMAGLAAPSGNSMANTTLIQNLQAAIKQDVVCFILSYGQTGPDVYQPENVYNQGAPQATATQIVGARGVAPTPGILQPGVDSGDMTANPYTAYVTPNMSHASNTGEYIN